MELLQVSGILFAFIIGAGTNVFWLSVIGGVIPFIFGSIFFFMPESPIYLLNEGRDLEAIQSYKWLRGQDFDSSEETVLLEQPEDNLSFMDTLSLHLFQVQIEFLSIHFSTLKILSLVKKAER